MIHAKNYETVFKSVKVTPRKLVASFFPDTVYNIILRNRSYSVIPGLNFYGQQGSPWPIKCNLSLKVRLREES